MLALFCLAAASTVSCGLPQERPWGHEFRPEVSGTTSFEATSGEVTEYPIDDDTCAGSWYEIVVGDPPTWETDGRPFITCAAALGVPELKLYDPDTLETVADWPDPSLDNMGAVWPGPEFELVPFDVTIEVSEGDLLDLPADSDPIPKGSDPATTPDYARTFRIVAEVNCAEVGLECDGTWRYDARYELSPDLVVWAFPPSE